jgi:beta-carotene ketolase (CrtW type)
MGVLIALLIISIWGGHLFYSLNYVEVSFASLWFYVHLLIQAYLYTGLFITAHDAMHGTISNSKIINKGIGIISTFLFAGMSYNRLIKNHFMHHKTPGEADDPDFNINSQNFFIWWFSFMIRYTTITQIIIMAIVFNLLKLFFGEINIWFFWVIPAFLGTLQLFYFGTYQPHRKPHTDDMKPHNARSQKLNHLWAMLSCYFFGYHHEHHESPRTPWWKLYKLKESNS